MEMRVSLRIKIWHRFIFCKKGKEIGCVAKTRKPPLAWSRVAPLTALYSLAVTTTLSAASKEGRAIGDYSAQQKIFKMGLLNVEVLV